MLESANRINNTAITNNQHMLATLQSWAQAGWIRWLDAEFAAFLYREAQDDKHPVSPLLLLGAALCSHQNGHGHLCLDLAYCLQSPDKALMLPPEHAIQTPSVTPAILLGQITLTQWIQALDQPLLCAHAADSLTASQHPVNTPLILQSDQHSTRLYLRRFWQYEQRLNESIQQRLQSTIPIDETALKSALDILFPRTHQQDPARLPDWQKIACALSIRNAFAIITGGPGTGKTTTVVKLLLLLQALHKQSQPESALLRIRLAAPTGKAAARLSASISSQLSAFAESDGIPREVSTVHRLLGPVRHSRYFKHNASNPLPADVVVIDEASMVDVEMMAQLMEALPDSCRLILLGDKDQLASVEAGAVLGSLCARANAGHYHQLTADWVNRVSGQSMPTDCLNDEGRALDQAITMLRYSHRFGSVPGIGTLADAVNRGADLGDIQRLFNGPHPELRWPATTDKQNLAFEKLVSDRQQGYGVYLDCVKNAPDLAADKSEWDRWAITVLTAHSTFQLLAALRKGESGVEELNKRIKQILIKQQLIGLPTAEINAGEADEWYAGRPVMITRNNYTLDLMNGDIGITLPYPNPASPLGSSLRVAFRDTADPTQLRWILPTRLQHVETVFAMTVHKSQGSEFSHTALVLPAHDSPVLTRELIYTGITRASKQFTLICRDPDVLKHAVQTRVFRAGGLAP